MQVALGPRRIRLRVRVVSDKRGWKKHSELLEPTVNLIEAEDGDCSINRYFFVDSESSYTVGTALKDEYQRRDEPL